MDTVGIAAYEHVAYLAEKIGCRPIGSPANLAAADYIARYFEQAGLAVEFQKFSCPDWAEEQTELILSGAYLEARANTFSPSCDLEAPTLALGTLAELITAGAAGRIEGRILIFYGELAQHELAARGAIYVPENDQEILKTLATSHPAGLITVNPTLYGMWRLVEDFDLELPSVTVSAASGLRLVRQPGETVRMRITTRRSPSYSANVIGRLPGKFPDRISLCAHYDTKVDTPGAYDNAAGIGALLTLTGRLSRETHRYALEWVAFSGEEIYGLGDMTYARRTGDFEHVHAAINFDGIGPYMAATSVAVFAASEPFKQRVRDLKTAFPGMIEVEPWPASDHYIFYSHGAPSLALSSLGVKDIYHTPEDSLEWISPDKLAEAVLLAEQVVRELDGREPGWSRPGERA